MLILILKDMDASKMCGSSNLSLQFANEEGGRDHCKTICMQNILIA